MKNYVAILGVASVLLASCGGDSSKFDPDYFAFKESKSDNWGLMNSSGKVLVSDEFKNRPSTVYHGVFFVPTDDGVEMYSSDEPTKPIGDKYKSVAYFLEDFAPSVKKEEGIKYIDKKGKVVFELPLEFVEARFFMNGYSIIYKKNDDHTTSVCAIDKKFNIFESKKYNIKNVLSNGNFLVSKKDDDDAGVFYIINKQEEEIQKIKTGTNSCTLSDDLKMYIYYDDNQYGVKKMDGSVVVRAKYDDVKFLDKYIVLKNDDGYGVFSMEGEPIIKNKYAAIADIKGDYIIAKRDNGDNFGMIDFSEERILKYDYKYLWFIPGTSNLYGKKDGDKSEYIFDEKGNNVAECHDIRIYNWDYLTVHSDYFDVDNLAKSLIIPIAGKSVSDYFGYEGMSASNVVNSFGMSIDADDIYYSDGLEFLPKRYFDDFEYGSYSYRVGFNQIVESYTDYSYGYYYHPTRYRFASNSHCNSLKIYVDLNDEAYSHIESIKSHFGQAMSSCGFSDVEESDSYTIYSNSKQQIKVVFNGDEIYLTVMPK